jgi:hypothetical protein
MFLTVMAVAAQALTPPVFPPPPMTVETHRDSITDRVSAYATLRQGDDRLVVGCDRLGGDIKVTVHTERWMVRGALFYGYRTFIYRFDRDRPRRLLSRPDDRSATLKMNRRIVPFLRSMAQSNELVVRMRDVEKNWFDTNFRLVNTGPVLNQLLTTCRRPDLAQRVFGEA